MSLNNTMKKGFEEFKKWNPDLALKWEILDSPNETKSCPYIEKCTYPEYAFGMTNSSREFYVSQICGNKFNLCFFYESRKKHEDMSNK